MTAETLLLPNKPEPSPMAAGIHRIDINKALELKAKGVSYVDLAQYFDVPKSTIHYHLQPLMPDTSNIDVFKKFRADLLTVKQESILKSLDDGSIKEMSGLQKATAFGILYDKERLERDKSTSNVSFNGMMGDYATLERERKAMLEELGLEDGADLEEAIDV